MDIIRGIIGFAENGRIVVDSPSHIFNLNLNEPYTAKLIKDDKILGVVIDDVFNVCYEFNLIEGNKAFGYILGNSNEKTVEIQLIKGFNNATFNPFEPSYELGDIISEDIIDLQNRIKWA